MIISFIIVGPKQWKKCITIPKAFNGTAAKVNFGIHHRLNDRHAKLSVLQDAILTLMQKIKIRARWLVVNLEIELRIEKTQGMAIQKMMKECELTIETIQDEIYVSTQMLLNV